MKRYLAKPAVEVWRQGIDFVCLAGLLLASGLHAVLSSPFTLLMLVIFGAGLGWRFWLRSQAKRTDFAVSDQDSHQSVRLERALNAMSQGLCMFDAEQRLIVCNERYAELYQMPRALMTPGTPFRKIVESRIHSKLFAVGNSADYIRERLAAVQELKPSVKIQELMDGRVIAISHRPMPEGGWLATHDDITEIRRIESQMVHLAHHDVITGLPNRVRFREELDGALAQVRRGGKLAVLCLDLDHFKAVNDSLGHSVGDDLLKAVANRLYVEVRDTDILARQGGDEFAIVQVGLKTPTEVSAFAQRIIDVLGRPYEIEGHQVVIGTSVGIALAPTDGLDADQLLKSADMALYLAKGEGRGIYRFFEPAMDARMQRRRATELELRRALRVGELEMSYQPLIGGRGEGIVACEALVCWRHTERGLVPASQFIPLAEEIGLINDIGSWVLNESCKEAAGWPSTTRLIVNVYPVQFRSSLVSSVVAALRQSGLPASRLELEITETVLLQDAEAALGILKELRSHGISISLDDFGTGYSSLNYLRKFPFDRIKIDRSFVQSLPGDLGSSAIIKAVAGLSAALGISITAEGIENAQQLTALLDEGCRELQGGLFSPPRPAGEIRHLLASFSSDRDKSSRSAA